MELHIIINANPKYCSYQIQAKLIYRTLLAKCYYQLSNKAEESTSSVTLWFGTWSSAVQVHQDQYFWIQLVLVLFGEVFQS